MLEQIKSVTIDVELNALKLLNGNADAETLHVANFGSLYAKACEKVTFLLVDVGGQQGHGQAQQHGKEFAPVEFMSVCRLEQNGGGDVKKDADQ